MQHYASLFAKFLFRGFPNSKDWETYQIQQILEKKSLEYAMNNQDVVHILKVNEYDLEMPQSNTADQPTHCVEETQNNNSHITSSKQTQPALFSSGRWLQN